MNQVCQDLLVLQDRLGSRRSHLRQRFREETRVTKDLLAFKVIQAHRVHRVPLVARKEKRENQERRANEVNQAKTVIQVLRDFQESKVSQACRAFQAGMARQDKKVIVDTRVHRDRWLADQ